MLRTIIESHEYYNNRNSIEPDVKRMDDILSGVVWALSRDPNIGHTTEAKGIYAITTDAYMESDKPLTIYYIFNNEKVILLDIIIS
jgi:hypothetical protein